MSQPSFRDVEQLSAYLDGQLSKADAARLEGRLKSDAQLRSAYDDLRQARSLLGRLPARRAPRNFTLTAQMAGIKPPVPGVFPFFRLASVCAAILFFVGYAINLSVPAVESIQTSVPMVAYGKGGGPGAIEQSAGIAAAPASAAPASAASDMSINAASASAPASVLAPEATMAPAGAAPLAVQPTQLPGTPTQGVATLASQPASQAAPIEPPINQSRLQPAPAIPVTLPVSPAWLSILLVLAVASGGIGLGVRARSESAWRSAHALKPAGLAARDIVLAVLVLLLIVLLAAGLYWMSSVTFLAPLP